MDCCVMNITTILFTSPFPDANFVVYIHYNGELKICARVLKKRHPGKLHLLFFTKKVCTVI